MRIVYAWELGGNRGHLSAVLPVLRRLRAMGHDVWICSPGTSLPEVAATEFAVRWRSTPKRFTTPIGRTLLGHAEILRCSGGFYDESNLLLLLRNWRAVLDELRCDVVIIDFAPAALLAAKTLGISSVVFDTGFFYPPPGVPFPVLDSSHANASERLREEERVVLQTVNACLAKLDTPSLVDFASLFRADDALLVNYAVLDCYARKDTSQFVGPVVEPGIALERTQRRAAGPHRIKIFAYLNRHFQALAEVLGTLANEPSLQSVVYISGSDAWHDRGRWDLPNIRLTADPSELHQHLADVDLVICHAGVGTISQALARGVPLGLLPMFREQQLNADRVRSLGLGDVAMGRFDRSLPAMIKRVAGDSAMRVRVAEFARTRRTADVSMLALRIEACAARGHERESAYTQCEKSNPPVHFGELDVVFLSFDEANADANFARLRETVPHAQRVHGVKGFDRAHREAGRIARTERFITVDADTVVHRAFFATRATVPAAASHSTWCWSATNEINGLVYGNGGVKIWNRQHLDMLLSHESGGAAYGMRYDFCFHAGYSQFSRCFATTFPNGSPYQAFRAGFREAVKLGRDGHGKVVPVAILQKGLHHVSFRRLIVWMSIGAEVTNGLWAILGARMGFVANFDPTFEPSNISDFDWFQSLWCAAQARVAASSDELDTLSTIERCIASLGDEIRGRYGLMLLKDWIPERSRQFKDSMASRRRNHDLFDAFERDI